MSTITTEEAYKERIEDILGGEFVNDQLRLEIDIDNVKDARNLHKRLILQQKQLRQVKRDVNADMKTIRAHYKTLSDNAQPTGGSIFMGLFGKKGGMRSSVADQRRKLRYERDDMLAPYDGVKQTVDDIITQMDLAKLNIKEWIEENK